jgi:hypothetical protein
MATPDPDGGMSLVLDVETGMRHFTWFAGFCVTMYALWRFVTNRMRRQMEREALIAKINAELFPEDGPSLREMFERLEMLTNAMASDYLRINARVDEVYKLVAEDHIKRLEEPK